MRSLRESFSVWGGKGSTPALGHMPKSGVGVLPHGQEQQLQQLWSQMIKAEEGCRRTESAVRQLSEEATAVQHSEEKLLNKLSEVNSGLEFSIPELDASISTLSRLLPEVGRGVPDYCEGVEEKVGGAVRDYHVLYTHVDALRIKRDALIADVNKINDKMERLRLKGRRSTDSLVEKERTLRQAQDVQTQLLQDAAKFHALRTDYLQNALHDFTDTQFLQYGSEAQSYADHVVGGPAHQPSLGRLNDSTAQHIAALEALNITSNSAGECASQQY